MLDVRFIETYRRRLILELLQNVTQHFDEWFDSGQRQWRASSRAELPAWSLLAYVRIYWFMRVFNDKEQ